KALHQSFQFVNGNKPKKGDIKGRIFVSKAIIIMCQAPKSRDADHLQCLLYDKKVGITDEEIVQGIKDADGEPMVDLPEYTFDCHTMKGKREGKTKADFMQDEFEALQPRTLGLFDDLVEESA
ncbi:hypothetical protein ACQVTS_32670, partial [Bacillus mycoides]|uniref:hypothetical protein n=1 Tax=Bacillus mycoides TaxID=1405 RepID=UPI003D64A28F